MGFIPIRSKIWCMRNMKQLYNRKHLSVSAVISFLHTHSLKPPSQVLINTAVSYYWWLKILPKCHTLFKQEVFVEQSLTPPTQYPSATAQGDSLAGQICFSAVIRLELKKELLFQCQHTTHWSRLPLKAKVLSTCQGTTLTVLDSACELYLKAEKVSQCFILSPY